MIRLRHGRGRRHQRVVIAAQVAGKHQSASRVIEFDDGRTQDVARAQEPDLHSPRKRRRRIEWDRAERGDRSARVGDRVQRQRGTMARQAVAVQVIGIGFLQVGAIQQ